MCGQEARMCFSFPEFRSSKEEKSHLLSTPPARGQAAPPNSAPRETPLRTVLELQMTVMGAVGVEVKTVSGAMSRLMMVMEV